MEETPLRERPADGLTIQECWVDTQACEQEIRRLRDRQANLHNRITAIEHEEARARMNPDRSLDQTVRQRG